MRRGYSLVELVVTISILAVFVPLAWAFVRRAEENRTFALDQRQTADELRTIAEELALDARLGLRSPDRDLAWTTSDCGVEYRISPQGVLVRTTTCGAARALATGVEALHRVPGGIEVTFRVAVRPDREQRTTVFFAVPS